MQLDQSRVRRLFKLYESKTGNVWKAIDEFASDPAEHRAYRDAVIDLAREGNENQDGELMCRFCDDGPFSSRRGRISHEARKHPQKRMDAVDRPEIARRYVEEGESIRDLATAYDVAVSFVHGVLDEYGIERRRRGHPVNDGQDEEIMILRSNGATYEDIRSRIGCSYERIARVIRDYRMAS